MGAPRSLFVQLAVVVAVAYAAQSQLPRFFDTCIDGQCTAQPAEIAVSLLIPLGIAALVVAAEMLLFGETPRQALRTLGYGRPPWATISLAVLITLPAALVFPICAWLMRSPITLAANWGWIVLTIFLFNGLVEESLFRGFVFGRLRRGRGFWRAATLSMFYFSAAHVPLLVTFGPVIGALGILVSIPTAYVTAYLFERGANTWWGPVVLHTVINTVPSIVFLSPEAQGTATSLYLATSTLANLVVLALLYWRGERRSVPVAAGIS